MRVSVSLIRFLFEAAFIVLIAAAAAVARLDKIWIALSVTGAWLLVSLVERTALKGRSSLRGGRLGFLFSGRRAQPEPDESALEEHPPTPLPEPELPAPEPAPPVPVPDPPTPEPGEPAQLRSVPAAAAEPEPEPPQAPDSVVAYLPRVDGEPREWNIWELERLAREDEGKDPARDEELAYLLLELRQFANAEGSLPVSFDPIVRESFSGLPSGAV